VRNRRTPNIKMIPMNHASDGRFMFLSILC
jgi:hypothetical protein